jgi:hypothetical protein
VGTKKVHPKNTCQKNFMILHLCKKGWIAPALDNY